MMPFELIPSETSEETGRPCEADPSRQLALFRVERADAAPQARGGKASLQDVQLHITHLTSQIETLRDQLRGHTADRLALLIREMIEERERELERWIAQEGRWEERVATIEAAIAERDAFRQRETELLRERDAARAEAEATGARLRAAEHTAEMERRKANSLERAAHEAQAEQLRLREERAVDETRWHSERRRLSAEMDRLKGGWIGRLIKA